MNEPPQERSGFDRDAIRSKVAGLAAKGVFIGTSSWKYPGWRGLPTTTACSLCQQMNVAFCGGVAIVNITDSKKFPAGDLDHSEQRGLPR